MTDFLNPTEVDDVVGEIVAMTGSEVDYSFECIGNVQVSVRPWSAVQGLGESYVAWRGRGRKFPPGPSGDGP